MAQGMLFEFPGRTQADYDTVMHRLGLDRPDAQWPEGIISHTAGPTESGGWCVVDTWESREAFERFYDSRLRQALQGTGMETSQPRWFTVHNHYQSDAGATRLRRAA